MSEIWNLSSVCRCCHSDGIFRNLDTPYVVENNVEIYSIMLRQTLGINIFMPAIEVSKTICEECVQKLQDAFYFKNQVVACEQKFEEYCKNEQALNENVETIKTELDTADNDEQALNENVGSIKIEFDRSNDGVYDNGEDSSLEYKDDKIYKMEMEINEIKREEDKLANGVLKTESLCKQSQKETPRKNIIKGGKVKKPTLKYESSLAKLRRARKRRSEYSCQLCPATYSTREALRAHIDQMKHEMIYKCEVCSQKFTSKSQHNRHLASVHSDIKPFKCKHCPRTFRLETSLPEHENLHTKQNLYQCDICNKMLKHKQTLKKHIQWHLGLQRKLICELCGGTFNDQCNLRKHVQTVHQKLKLYKCQLCPKEFAANKGLKVHMRQHTGERPFSCDICGKSFTSYSTCKSHIFTHDPKFRYKCKVCTETFEKRGAFAKHTKMHVGMKPLVCHICGQDFTCKYSLKRHIFEHTGVKPFVCDKCDCRFSQKCGLIRHNKRFHSGTVRSPADRKQCGLCKRLVYNIEKHLQTHNNRPHVCEYCNKTYAARNILNRHVLSVHLGLKSFNCQFCDKKYKQRNALKHHYLKAHKMPLKTELEENMDSVVTKYTIANKYRKKKICVNNLTVDMPLIEESDKK
ncbi:zinc finger protein ZFP2-like [Galleria mellonella]|uniref:Zinc finger protein ZFP2-like n=1 Tax=Galleria mellonella TaxID=7137 RepID=A0A6J1WI22_GALME|nr:zinc finger protein ZFP2-like [Galleria mellonella]